MSQTVSSVEDLVVEYPVPTGTFRAVDSVSFSVDRGATVAIVGESGCGKSTIAKSIVRLLTPTSGRIVVDGTDIAQLSEKALRPFRSRVQMVFQDPYGSLDPHLTAVDIVGEPLRLQGVRDKRERAQRAAQLMERVGLPTTALHRRPVESSVGNASASASPARSPVDPEILVCDEATSALDVSVQAQVLDLLREIQKDTGLTYVFISHNLGVVREISETVAVMSKGRVVESGATADVLAHPREPYTQALRAAALDPISMVGIKPRHITAKRTPEPTPVSQQAAMAPPAGAAS